MSSHLVMLVNALISVKFGLQGLTAHSRMEAELVTAALTMKESVLCPNMKELGFGGVPVCTKNMSTLHVAGNRSEA